MARPPARPARIKKAKKQPKQPETAEEFLDAAVEEEDQGDRWLASDLAKAVRFYQRSGVLYNQVLSKSRDPQIRHDALYNIARMQYLIYSKVIRPGFYEDIAGSLLDQATTTSTTGGVGVVELSIGKIIDNHQYLCENNENPEFNTLDALFNFAQVLTEAGEEEENPRWFRRALEVFNRVYHAQKDQLAGWIQRLSSAESSAESSEDLSEEQLEASDSSGEVSGEMERSSRAEEAVVPSTLLETLLAYLGCVTEFLDILTYKELQDNADLEALSSFLLGEISQLLQMSPNISENLRITPEEYIEALITVAKHRTSLELSKYTNSNSDNLLQLISAIWNEPVMADTMRNVERALQESDAYMEAANNLGASNLKSWEAYSMAINVVQQALNDTQAQFGGLDKIKLWIQRGDIEFSRAKLDVPAAHKNRSQLIQNAGVFYKNAAAVQSLLKQAKLLHQEASIKRGILAGEPVKTIPKYLEQDLRDLGFI